MEDLGSRAQRAITACAREVGLGGRADEMWKLVASLSGEWPRRSVDERHTTGVTGDGTPLEISMPIDGEVPELRLGFEPQGRSPSPFSNWEAALEALDRMEHLGASVSTLRAALPMFAPVEAFFPPIGVCLAAAFVGDGPPVFRAYLSIDTAIRRGHSLEDVLGAFGARSVAPRTFERAEAGARVGMLAVDLVGHPSARTKLYTLHVPVRPAGYEGAERVGALGAEYREGDATELVDAIRPFEQRPAPMFVCTTVHATGEKISRTTTNVRVMDGRALGLTTGDITRRVAAYLERKGRPTAELLRLARLFRSEEPDAFDDYTFVSTQREAGQLRVVTYFSPRLHERDWRTSP